MLSLYSSVSSHVTATKAFKDGHFSASQKRSGEKVSEGISDGSTAVILQAQTESVMEMDKLQGLLNEI